MNSTISGVTSSRHRSHSRDDEAVFPLVRVSRREEDRADEERYAGAPVSRRRRWVRVLGAFALVGALSACVALLTNPNAQQEVLSWLTIGHADTVREGVRSLQQTVNSLRSNE